MRKGSSNQKRLLFATYKVKGIYNNLCFEFRPQTSTVPTFSPLGPRPLRWSSANFYLHALPTLPACQCGAREVLSEETKQENMMRAFLSSSSRPHSHARACTTADEECLGGAQGPRARLPSGCYTEKPRDEKGMAADSRTKQEVSR